MAPFRPPPPGPTWVGAPPPAPRSKGTREWVRILRRGVPLGLTTFGGLAVLLALRLVERPLFGARRPITPWITRGVCVAAFWWLGLRRQVSGRPVPGPGAAVANHASWLDIFALNASDPVYFVAKAEVASWPGIGWLARATGTVFIRRARGDAASQTRMMGERLAAEHRLLFFPEGTSTDGQQVLPFKTTLFAAFFAEGVPPSLTVQPITLRYMAPDGADPRFYGWWGDSSFGAHLLEVLAAPRQGTVEVIYHAPIAVAQTEGRKALAASCEAAVRAGLRQVPGQS